MYLAIIATFNANIIQFSLFRVNSVGQLTMTDRDRLIREEMRTRKETSKEIKTKMITKHF